MLSCFVTNRTSRIDSQLIIITSALLFCHHSNITHKQSVHYHHQRFAGLSPIEHHA
jgi:hypothetical protein